MKKIIFFCLGVTMNAMLLAQSPAVLNYQSVVRDAAGAVKANRNVNFRISILEGSINGTAVLRETHLATTNEFGLVSLEIGKGYPVSGSLASINWGSGSYFLKVELDPSGGTSFIHMGTNQLVSVPYALHAKTVQNDQVNDADADPANEIQELRLSGTQLTLTRGGGTVTLPSSGGGDNWGTQVVQTDGTLTGNGTASTPLKISDNGVNSSKIQDGSIVAADLAGSSISTEKLASLAVTTGKIADRAVTAEKLSQSGAATGQVLKWKGTEWGPDQDLTGGLTLPYASSASSGNALFSLTNSGMGSALAGIATNTEGTTKGVYGVSSSNYPESAAVFGEKGGCCGYGIYGIATGGGSNWGVFGRSDSNYGVGVEGKAPMNGVVGRATSSGEDRVIGVYGESNGVFGYGVSGKGAVGINGEGSRYGVIGKASNTQGEKTVGAYGLSDSPDGTGVLGMVSSTGETHGVKGIVTSATGYGVLGDSPKYGVYGKASGIQGRAVYGEATNTASIGVIGQALNTNCTGVWGEGSRYDFYAAGPGENYASSSSIRWKENIRVIPDPLGKVQAIRGVYFDWDEGHGGRHDVGMIAEEVGRVLPEIVVYEDNGIDANGMDYSKITPLLVEAVKELKAENDRLKERLNNIERLIKAETE